MKKTSRTIVLSLATLAYVALGVGCSATGGKPVSPQDAAAYSQIVHGGIHDALGDYKDVRDIARSNR